MPILITGLFAPSGGADSFDLYAPEDIQAGSVNVVLQAIAGGSFKGGSHATSPAGEIVAQVKTTTAAPTHSASLGTLCWNSVDLILYTNNNGSTGWTAIGSGSGSVGPMGPPGIDGVDGEPGMSIPGPVGAVGATGSAGAKGDTGDTGPAGVGLVGPPGFDGLEGEPGPPIPGPSGPPGASIVGPSGMDGERGEDGFPIPGPIGPAGATGADGPPGASIVGPMGPRGQDGEDGEPGSPIPGPAGATGSAGSQGIQGVAGATVVGPPGENGEDGETRVIIQTQASVRGINIVLDGGGSAITTGTKTFFVVPFACTINTWTIIASAEPTATNLVIDIHKLTIAAPPTGASICASELPTLTTSDTDHYATGNCSGWTTAIAAGGIFEVIVDTAPGTTALATLALKVTVT